MSDPLLLPDLGSPPTDQIVPPKVAQQAKLQDVYGLLAEHINVSNQRFRWMLQVQDGLFSRINYLQVKVKNLHDVQLKLLQENSQSLAYLLATDRSSAYTKGFNNGYSSGTASISESRYRAAPYHIPSNCVCNRQTSENTFSANSIGSNSTEFDYGLQTNQYSTATDTSQHAAMGFSHQASRRS